ncbi:hypothetical protein BJ912DRAFT_451802 [Pholiota molesta]|nr:hypothetical protein BJ912DRAFT_451802 [Pholiota molesta]
MEVQGDPAATSHGDKHPRSSRHKGEYDDELPSIRRESDESSRHKSSRHDPTRDTRHGDSVTSSRREHGTSKDEYSRRGRDHHHPEHHGHNHPRRGNHHDDVGRHPSETTDDVRQQRAGEYEPRHHRRREEIVDDRAYSSSRSSHRRSHASEIRGLQDGVEDKDHYNARGNGHYDVESRSNSDFRHREDHSSISRDAKGTANGIPSHRNDDDDHHKPRHAHASDRPDHHQSRSHRSHRVVHVPRCSSSHPRTHAFLCYPCARRSLKAILLSLEKI